MMTVTVLSHISKQIENQHMQRIDRIEKDLQETITDEPSFSVIQTDEGKRGNCFPVTGQQADACACS